MKEERLNQRVNRIEEKMMEKEIYNYTYIQNKIQKRKEQAREKATRNKEQEENMVPEIFRGMEEADNSDGFDSCEEAKSEHAETEQKKSLKKCGNPF